MPLQGHIPLQLHGNPARFGRGNGFTIKNRQNKQLVEVVTCRVKCCKCKKTEAIWIYASEPIQTMYRLKHYRTSITMGVPSSVSSLINRWSIVFRKWLLLVEMSRGRSRGTKLNSRFTQLEEGFNRGL